MYIGDVSFPLMPLHRIDFSLFILFVDDDDTQVSHIIIDYQKNLIKLLKIDCFVHKIYWKNNFHI